MILFGWRFTPTLIAVLYAQMTVILFEDVKRTEPFARLAKAPTEGTSAYGTILQTPRAWWSIFMDICFYRKRIGKTSWSLICAALVNLVALLIISPLSSALLTTEEAIIPGPIEFTRLVPNDGVQLPTIATRDTYFRTMAALMRNVSTSVWVTDTSLTFPFWPSSELSQIGPKLTSSYGAWNAEATTLRSNYVCHDMKLESADLSDERYSEVYSVQQYGPYKGTQPMVTFVLDSDQGCRYELKIHPFVDLAYNGGMAWTDATTFFPTTRGRVLPIGGRVVPPNVTSTHVYARVNATQECSNHDIILMSTPWTASLNQTEIGPFVPDNMTYERSSEFRMRGMLCSSHYSMSTNITSVTSFGSPDHYLNASAESELSSKKLPDNLVNISTFQATSMQDNWRTYFDALSMETDAKRAGESELGPREANKFPGYSGMAPMLAALSGFNLTALINDPNITQTAARIKGRFFMETICETLDLPDFIKAEKFEGSATVVQERVVVLTEIGFTLAALFYASAVFLAVLLWASRLPHRPLNLHSDPSSIVGLSLLLQSRLVRTATLRNLHDASRSDFYNSLRRENYLMSDRYLIQSSVQPSMLRRCSMSYNELANIGRTASIPPLIKAKSDWRPRVIHVRMLLALIVLLTSIIAAILTLNAFSARSLLSQVGFTYEADISKLNLSFPTFAPISIAPTVASIVIGLWWDQLDMTFRTLQPYISMSQGPMPVSTGAGLTYKSKTWVGAAFKAARFRHWVLFMVAVGSVLAQILTVSMSALFERRSTNTTKQVTLLQNLEMRQDSLVSEMEVDLEARPYRISQSVLNELYLDARKNWLYGAGIQQSFNGSQLPWSSGGWSFLPVDLSHVSNITGSQTLQDTYSSPAIASTNVSLQVPAIRARLECNSIEEISNVSSWLEPANLTREGSILPEDIARLEGTGGLQLYKLPIDIFENSSSETTTFSTREYQACCANGTIEQPHQSVIGYWSAIGARPPYDEHVSWPLSVVPKWIVGKLVSVEDFNGYKKLYFREEPRMQAANCQPIIETTGATIAVDAETGDIISWKVDGPVEPMNLAWADAFTRHEVLGHTPALDNRFYEGPMNITTSFGILFLGSILGSANRNFDDNAFVFRDKERGIDMDLMTNTMYAMADKDAEALLDYTTFTELADRTFQMFFQQFVNSGLSLAEGGFTYQPVNDKTMDNLSRPIHANGTVILKRETVPARSISASVSTRIRVLHMNTVATYLSAAILTWLTGTTFIIICLQRKYTGSMIRDVQLIADMLVLVAGSDNFLELVQERGVALKKDREVQTMLGWFKDRDGEVRWGIEVVGGRDPVQWVDAPETGNHIQEKSPPKAGRLLLWRKN